MTLIFPLKKRDDIDLKENVKVTANFTGKKLAIYIIINMISFSIT